MLESKLNALLRNGQFDEAAMLFRHHLAAAEFVDPRDDYSWGPASDGIGYRILDELGAQAFAAYWEDLLTFFQDELEPAWGHLPKGHIFFRLGLAKFAQDVAEAKRHLKEALAEDQIVAETVAGDWGLKVEELVHRFPSYVCLCILERIEARDFESEEDERRFYQGLVPLHLDVIWDRKEVELSLVRRAIGTLVPEPGQALVLAAREELQSVSAQELSVATLNLVSGLLEMVLFQVLYHRQRVRAIGEKRISQARLGELLNEAIERDVFPTDAVRSTCQLVHILKCALLHAGEETYEYEIDTDLLGLIGLALKILLDSAMVEWAARISA
jgi:hypothetical protein